MNASELAVDVRGLCKRFGARTVVDHIDLQLPRGRIFGFLGPNGSGKTTTIRMLCGLLTPDAGGGVCLGMDLRRDARRIRREVGYMTQKFSFYDDLSVSENLMFVARVYDCPQPRQRVRETLQSTGLERRCDQLAGTLSGGWKQRLALAACLLHTPQLLLLDEPTAGVDPQARREFWQLIHQLAAQGITILVSTHYMDEAERCHHLAYIRSGKLLASDTPQGLVAAHDLAVFALRGDGINSTTLASCPVIEQSAAFGISWHVSIARRIEAETALRAFADAHRWQLTPVEASLEDVFIRLQQRELPAATEMSVP